MFLCTRSEAKEQWEVGMNLINLENEDDITYRVPLASFLSSIR